MWVAAYPQNRSAVKEVRRLEGDVKCFRTRVTAISTNIHMHQNSLDSTSATPDRCRHPSYSTRRDAMTKNGRYRVAKQMGCGKHDVEGLWSREVLAEMSVSES